MIPKEIKFLILGGIVASIGTLFVASNFSITPSTTSVTTGEETAFLTYHAVVCKTVTRADGTVEDLGCNKNIFNLEGMNFTRDQISGVTAAQITGLVTVIAVANKTSVSVGTTGIGCAAAQADTNTFLCGEYNTCGLSRAAGTVRTNSSANPNAGNWTITNEFTATGSCDVNATGLYNTTTLNQSNEIFFAQNTFTTASLANNDKVNVTWFIWVV